MRVFDHLYVNIAKELLNDPEVRSADIAAKYKMPLSTVQRRRRARLEMLVLKKTYEVNIQALGWRNADICVAVESGKSEEVANMLLEKHGHNVAHTSLQIGDPDVDVMASAYFRTFAELHEL
jgi:DNA-binding Lrp family transcriptional regulator